MQKILDIMALEVQGGVSEGIMLILDRLIDNGTISQEWFDANEMQLLTAIDEEFFECEICDWTVPIEIMAHNGDRVCDTCVEEED